MYWPECKKTAAQLIRSRKVEADGKLAKPNTLASKNLETPEDLQIVVSMQTAFLKEMTTLHKLSQIKSQNLRNFINQLMQRTFAAPDSSLNEKDMGNIHLPLKKISGLFFAEIQRIMSEWFGGVGELAQTEEELERAKGKCLVVALCQCPDVIGGTTKFFNMIPVWKLVQQWHSIPYLIETLSTKITGNQIQRSTVLKLLLEFCEALVADRERHNGALKFTLALQSHNWMQAIRNILQHPDKDTWAVVSKYENIFFV